MRHFIFSIAIFLFFSFHAAAFPTQLQGISAVDSKKITISSQKKKGMVVVFLSAQCPCSNSHVSEVAALAKEYSNFNFVAVHSNSDESKEDTLKYFKQANLSFPVIEDKEAKIADSFHALKTPHAFIVLPNGDLAYQGGVSSSQDFSRAEHKFLREALADISADRPVANPKTRTLGCMISRGKKHAM